MNQIKVHPIVDPAALEDEAEEFFGVWGVRGQPIEFEGKMISRPGFFYCALGELNYLYLFAPKKLAQQAGVEFARVHQRTLRAVEIRPLSVKEAIDVVKNQPLPLFNPSGEPGWGLGGILLVEGEFGNVFRAVIPIDIVPAPRMESRG